MIIQQPKIFEAVIIMCRNFRGVQVFVDFMVCSLAMKINPQQLAIGRYSYLPQLLVFNNANM